MSLCRLSPPIHWEVPDVTRQSDDAEQIALCMVVKALRLLFCMILPPRRACRNRASLLLYARGGLSESCPAELIGLRTCLSYVVMHPEIFQQKRVLVATDSQAWAYPGHPQGRV